nr:hypothetical protein [Tanacetum cinerariifolium]
MSSMVFMLVLWKRPLATLMVLLNNQNKTTKEKHTSSEVHHRADSESVPACVSTGRSNMAVTIIGAASPILNVVHAANKDAAAYNMVSSLTLVIYIKAQICPYSCKK